MGSEERGVRSGEWGEGVGSGNTQAHTTLCIVPITASKLHFMNKTTDVYS